MTFAPATAASGLVAASVLWLVRLSGGTEDLAVGPAMLLGLDLVLLSLVAAAGLLIARSAWARAMGILMALAPLPLLIIEPDRDLLIWGAAGFSMLTLAMLLSPGVARWVGTSHDDSGPPRTAVAFLTGLLFSPAVSAATSPSGTTTPLWLLAAAGPLVAIGYSRASVGALWAARVATMPLCLAAAMTAPLAGGVLVIGYGLVITTLSWQRSVLLATAPLTPLPSPGYRIPPEMTPAEVLEAADLDESGRRRR
jgi:hypothetical protein